MNLKDRPDARWEFSHTLPTLPEKNPAEMS